MKYDINKPWLTLDPWQKEVIEEKGNVVVRSGRQVGKSTAIAVKTIEFARKNPNKTVLIIASVERQAYLLFRKVLDYLEEKYPKNKKGRATMTFVELKNGSKIRCLPAGLTGQGIRGYTVDLLIADEAAFIPEMVWTAITPMMAVTKGKMILLSTPHGREGYYYNRFKDPSFKSWHISAEDSPRKNQSFLDEEKKRMTKLQYTQEYLGEFIDELRQLFPSDLIKETMCLEREIVSQERIDLEDYYLGVDVARMGGDESTFEIINATNKEKVRQIENITTTKTRITDTIRKILELERKYSFKKIYIDDGGMGVGVFDYLLENDETKRKVVAINNASRSLDRKTQRKKLLKEDLYNNLLRLMERKEIKLLTDEEIFLSLASIQYEYTENIMKIFGNYSHIAEGLIRASWGVKDKSLNPFIN